MNKDSSEIIQNDEIWHEANKITIGGTFPRPQTAKPCSPWSFLRFLPGEPLASKVVEGKSQWY